MALLGKCKTIALFETLFFLRGFDTTILPEAYSRDIPAQNNADGFFFVCSVLNLSKEYVAKWKNKADFMAKIT